MDNKPYLSVIITAKDLNDQKLKDLQFSLTQQTYQDFETIIVTEGDSENAKAIGLKKAKGDIIGIFASDNYLDDVNFLNKAMHCFQHPIHCAYPVRYSYVKYDNILNRYFALIGGNDVIPLYLKRNDKFPYWINIPQNEGIVADVVDIFRVRTLGDNGFFVRKDILLQADIEHYYHIDVCQDLFNLGYKKHALIRTSIWHRTGGNFFKFFAKRFKYADKFNTPHRRWHMVETRKDYANLLWFIFCTLTVIQPLYLSVKGYRVIKDKAWFLHYPVCLMTLIVYTLWTLKRLIKNKKH
jgi:uncharacterized membrane protein